MSTQKKHTKNTRPSAKYSKHMWQKRNRRIYRLSIKCALWTSAFTFTLFATEWDILKPQPDSWKQHSADTMAQLSADTNGADASLAKPAGNQVQTKAADTEKPLRKTHNRNADSSEQTENGKLVPKQDKRADSNHTASSENSTNIPEQEKETGNDHVIQQDQTAAGQDQIMNTDEQTRYSADTHTDGRIYYSYAESPEQFSADNSSQIQSVPEHLPTGQLVDTTADDDTQHLTQASSDWNLILVNPWNEVPDDYEISLTNLPNGHSIDSRCYPALTEMMNACRGAGLQPLICSSYRSQEKQESLFQERIDELRAQGYSKKEARIKAATSVARPGTSEHQIGLAVDIVDQSHQTLDAMQEYTPVQQWLMENSWKYGFILRYPNDKSRLTGIIYEPWHYRYVGPEAAQEIYEQGICLEEYLEERQKSGS